VNDNRQLRRDVRKGRCGPGFTLLELLTVIMIIGLLVSILMPSINAIIKASYAAVSLARIKELDSGAVQYRQTFNFYPAQQYPEQLTGNSGAYTGSQVLAACLYNYSYVNINIAICYDPVVGSNPGQPVPDGMYAPLRKVLRDVKGYERLELPDPRLLGTAAGRNNSFLDDYPGPMAVLYYPARKGEATPAAAYPYGDNIAYVEANDIFQNYKARMAKDSSYSASDYSTEMRGVFQGNGYAGDDKLGTVRPRREGEFLLIAPGTDRLYFTPDDIKNW